MVVFGIELQSTLRGELRLKIINSSASYIYGITVRMFRLDHFLTKPHHSRALTDLRN